MKFVWGIIWIIAGIGLIKYSFQITTFFGHIPWAEEHIGGGGTFTLYKIVGVIVILLALASMFGNANFLGNPFGHF